MSLATRITALAQAIGADVKALEGIAIPGGLPGGASGAVQFNNGGTFAGAASVLCESGHLVLATTTGAPAAPSEGCTLYSKSAGNARRTPMVRGSNGVPYALQTALFGSNVFLWSPGGNAATVPGIFGGPAMTVVGTATARTVATNNLLTRMKRLAYVSAATAAAMCSVRGQNQFTTGDAAAIPLGGFFASFRFAFTDAAAVAGARAFVGMNNAAPTNVEPSTRTNHFGIAQLSTSSTQLHFVYGGSAAQAAIPLGTGFPPMAGVGANNGVPYELQLWCPPDEAGVIHWQLNRLDTGTSTGGSLGPTTLGVQTPAPTTLLAPSLWRCNNATLLACAIDVDSVYIETAY